MALIRIDLTEELGAGQYLEIRDPKKLPWGVQRELQSTMKDDSVESQVAFIEKLAITIIKNGNVLDEDGNAVSFPLNETNLQAVPAIAIEAVAQKFTEIRAKGAEVPKN